MSRVLRTTMLLVMVLSMAAPTSAQLPAAPPERLATAESPAITQALPSALPAPAAPLAPSAVVTITVLHTNDFHGKLEPSGTIPGMARVATAINQVRASVGSTNTLLVDAGDIMQGSLLSNLYYGESTIDVYKTVGYNVATFGNHEFDWGQTTLLSRTQQAQGVFPFVSANIVVSDSSSCATAG